MEERLGLAGLGLAPEGVSSPPPCFIRPIASHGKERKSFGIGGQSCGTGGRFGLSFPIRSLLPSVQTLEKERGGVGGKLLCQREEGESEDWEDVSGVSCKARFRKKREKSAPHGLYSFGGFVAPEFRPPASK